MLLRTFSAHAKVVARDAKEMRNTRTRGLVLSPVSLGGSSYFLWKRCVVFQQMKNNFYLPCQFFENRRSIRMLLFLRMIDLTEHFIVKQKSILKHQKLLLQDVTLRAWVLKKSLKRQGSVNQRENSSKSKCKLTFHLRPSRFIG